MLKTLLKKEELQDYIKVKTQSIMENKDFLQAVNLMTLKNIIEV